MGHIGKGVAIGEERGGRLGGWESEDLVGTEVTGGCQSGME